MHIFLFVLIFSCYKYADLRTPYERNLYAGLNDDYGSQVKKVTHKQREILSQDLGTPYSATQSLKPLDSYRYETVNPSKNNANHKAYPKQNFEEPKTILMEVGDNIIKVSSSLHSDELEKTRLKYPDKKYHHVIEIIPRGKELEITENESTSQTSIETVPTGASTDTKTLLEDTENTSDFLDTTQQNSESVINSEGGGVESIDLRAGGEGSVFLEEGSGEEMFDSNEFENDRDKSGRLLRFFSQQNDTSPVCRTPKNESGRCRPFSHCLLSNALNNFNLFLQYLCLIRGARVGICCPDNPVIEITNHDENVTVSDSDREIKQPPEGCGLNIKTRIVGGTISVPHEWSWMVALMRRNRFFCGGVIINNWYVLTAAHCVLGVDVKDLMVRLGEYNFSTKKGHEEDLSVAEIKRHSQFVTLTFQHDIALLKLRRNIKYTKFVGSICLPSQMSRDYSDVQGTVVGWGTVSFGGAASPILRQVTIPVWKNKDCDRTYVLEKISDAFMCAGSPEKGEDACQGDSGGPLMTLNSLGRWEVIGIVSWGRRCGDPTYPGVYTRVTTYTDWINQNTT